MMNVVSGRVTEDQHLEDRRNEENYARPLIAKDLDEFLD
jgi:hypothetical protein